MNSGNNAGGSGRAICRKGFITSTKTMFYFANRPF